MGRRKLLYFFIKPNQLLLILLLVVFGVGCAESQNDSFGSQFQVLNPIEEKVIDVTDTFPEVEPETIPQAKLKIIRGLTELGKTQALWNRKSGEVTLRGTFKVRSNEIAHISFEFTGLIQKRTDFVLKASDETKSRLQPGVEFGARAMCFQYESNSCQSLIVDFILKKDSVVYVHQGQILLEDFIERGDSKSPSEKQSEKDSSEATKKDQKDDQSTQEPRQFPQPPLGKKESSREKDDKKQDEIETEEEENDQGHDHEENDIAGAYNTSLDEKEIQETLDRSLGKKEDSEASEKQRKNLQLQGAPNEGRLLMPQNFREKMSNNINLLRTERKRYYATKELVQLLNWMGEYSMSLSKQKLVVGDLSAAQGGKIGTHRSHQTGLDVDLGYMVRWGSHFQTSILNGRLVDGFLIYQQWELFKQTVNLGVIDRIFIHRSIKQALCRIAIQKKEITPESQAGIAFETLRRLIPDTDHNTHYHLRIKCPKNEVLCRQMVEPPRTTGCYEEKE